MKIFETETSIAVFSDKSDGDLNFYQFSSEDFIRFKSLLTKKLSVETNLPIYVNQVHKDNIFEVSNINLESDLSKIDADGLITSLSNTPVGVFTADCCPVLIASKKAVSATHAGWKSTCLNICEKTVKKHTELYKTTPNELTAWIGPCIGNCCFEIGDEVYDQFVTADSNWSQFFTKKEKWHLNLRALNRYQLEKAGIPSEQIIDFNVCTYCMTDKYFSYRRMKKRNGSMFSFIIKKS